ncbi:MAG TPA: diguanylate cyclase [Kofleriaceae bacterium]|nr:diguanylate cyclase [Kofleriaceae bacterium]
MTVLKAVIVAGDVSAVGELRDALSDAGCTVVATVTPDVAVTAIANGATLPDLVVLSLAGESMAALQQIARAHRDLMTIVICESHRIDAVMLAGAAECVVTPVRPQELRGRLRQALRTREAARQRSEREQRLSAAIIALEQEKQQLERLACVDPLTGVANRRHTLALLKGEWRRSSRERLPLALVMIDLDCFHAYNELYGHLGGDACLRRVNEVMATCLRRPSDYLGRYGGEEFVAVLPNTDAGGARLVAERLRAAVEALRLPHGASTCSDVVTITAGFASLEVTPEMTVDQLIGQADAALLRAKAHGRNLIDGEGPVADPTDCSKAWISFDPVHADPWFADRIPRFLAEVQVGAQDIVNALRRDDSEAVSHTVAGLRAGARDLGLALVEHIVDDLELATIERDPSTALKAADELTQYVTHVQVIYRRASDTARSMRAVTSS